VYVVRLCVCAYVIIICVYVSKKKETMLSAPDVYVEVYDRDINDLLVVET